MYCRVMVGIQKREMETDACLKLVNREFSELSEIDILG